jgi:hypothetical protein
VPGVHMPDGGRVGVCVSATGSWCGRRLGFDGQAIVRGAAHNMANGTVKKLSMWTGAWRKPPPRKHRCPRMWRTGLHRLPTKSPSR